MEHRDRYVCFYRLHKLILTSSQVIGKYNIIASSLQNYLEDVMLISSSFILKAALDRHRMERDRIDCSTWDNMGYVRICNVWMLLLYQNTIVISDMPCHHDIQVIRVSQYIELTLHWNSRCDDAILARVYLTFNSYYR